MVVNCGITTVDNYIEEFFVAWRKTMRNYSGFLIEHTIILCVWYY